MDSEDCTIEVLPEALTVMTRRTKTLAQILLTFQRVTNSLFLDY